MTLPTWNFAVVAEMNSSRPIASLDSPRASRVSTSRSRVVRSGPVGGGGADSERTTIVALWLSKALSPRRTARIAATSATASTSLST